MMNIKKKKKKKEKERKAMPALFPPSSLTWDVIHPGACAGLGLQTRLLCF